MKATNRSFLLAALLAATTHGRLDAAPQYRVIGLGPANVPSSARAINNLGFVAGQMGRGAFTWNGRHLVRYKPDQFLYLGGGYTNIAVSINRDGVAVGRNGNYSPVVMSGLAITTATMYRNGAMTYLDKAKNATFVATGINDAGTIVGEDAYRAFLREPNGTTLEIHPLSTRPEYNGSFASAIDNEGRVVGGTTIDVGPVGQVQCGEQRVGFNGPLKPMYCPDTNAYLIHAFLATFHGGAQHMRDLGALPGYPDTFATAIAEDGTVVGYSGTRSGPKWTEVSGPSRAWMWYRGRMSALGTLHVGDSTAAFGVNDRGVVVGCSSSAAYPWFRNTLAPPFERIINLTAIRWVQKRAVDLNTLIPAGSGWWLLCARAVNRSGWIVGDGMYRGVHRAFVLIPLRRL